MPRIVARYGLLLLLWLSLGAPSMPAQQPTLGPLGESLRRFIRRAAENNERALPHFLEREFRSRASYHLSKTLNYTFKDIGLKPIGNSPDYLQPLDGGGQNIIGVVAGNDAARKGEFVIIGAHYDYFGEPFWGAMDNAAGVAVMLEVARLLAQNPPQRSLLFIAFDGGEHNNAGAKFYAEHPVVPLDMTAAAVMLSGFGGGMSERLYETLYVIGTEFSPQLHSAVSKHKRGAAHLALIGRDTTRFHGGEHFNFTLGPTPTITITNGVHYAYHSKADTPNRINYAALEKHVATLVKVIAEIANAPGKIEKQALPSYDADEAGEWVRVLTALRENVIKTPANNAGQAQIDDVLLELKRHQHRPVQDPKAREAVILRAASIAFYIANPNGVEYDALLNAARGHEQRGERQQAIAAYQKLLKFVTDEYRRDEQAVSEIRQRIAKLGGK